MHTLPDRIARTAVEEGAEAFAVHAQHLANDIWHVPSVRATEYWIDQHGEEAVAALMAALHATDYRDDTGLPDGPYTNGFRDACLFIRRAIFCDADATPEVRNL
jgi:hypothetical protein